MVNPLFPSLCFKCVRIHTKRYGCCAHSKFCRLKLYHNFLCTFTGIWVDLVKCLQFHQRFTLDEHLNPSNPGVACLASTRARKPCIPTTLCTLTSILLVLDSWLVYVLDDMGSAQTLEATRKRIVDRNRPSDQSRLFLWVHNPSPSVVYRVRQGVWGNCLRSFARK